MLPCPTREALTRKTIPKCLAADAIVPRKNFPCDCAQIFVQCRSAFKFRQICVFSHDPGALDVRAQHRLVDDAASVRRAQRRAAVGRPLQRGPRKRTVRDVHVVLDIGAVLPGRRILGAAPDDDSVNSECRGQEDGGLKISL